MAHAIGAILLASATATTSAGRLASSPEVHPAAGACSRANRRTDVAPIISSRRMLRIALLRSAAQSLFAATGMLSRHDRATRKVAVRSGRKQSWVGYSCGNRARDDWADGRHRFQASTYGVCPMPGLNAFLDFGHTNPSPRICPASSSRPSRAISGTPLTSSISIRKISASKVSLRRGPPGIDVGF